MNKKIVTLTLVTGFSLLSILGTSQAAEASAYRSLLQNSITNQPTVNQPAPVVQQPSTTQPQQTQNSFENFWLRRRASLGQTTPTTNTQPTNTAPTQPTNTNQQTVAPQPISPVINHNISQREMNMLNWINEERAKVGVAPLRIDVELSKWARIKSQDMKDNNYFSHHSPTYGSPFEMMRNAGIQYRSAAENISSSQSPLISHHRLMASDGHRRNILNPNFTHIGIGIVDQNSSGVLVTQLFNQK